MPSRSRIPALAADRERRHASGFSMIEVLVALVVVSLGIGGILIAQARGYQALNGAGFRAQAAVLAEQIIDRARANPVDTGRNYERLEVVMSRDDRRAGAGTQAAGNRIENVMAGGTPIRKGYSSITLSFSGSTGAIRQIDLSRGWIPRSAWQQINREASGRSGGGFLQRFPAAAADRADPHPPGAASSTAARGPRAQGAAGVRLPSGGGRKPITTGCAALGAATGCTIDDRRR